MQVIYAHAADVVDRYDAVVALIRQAAAGVDDVFVRSAAETGGVRHVRWVTDDSCALSVARVALSTSGDDNFLATQTELQALGFNRTDRKYLVMVDATVYCGLADVRPDDRAGADNGNESGPGYARVDSGCWAKSMSVEAHELMHNLGGVQLSAPHSSGAFHCTEEYERMCYADSAGLSMTNPCVSTHETLFDCNHDDYFHTSPPAGSYLATHWNPAMSSFLESGEPGSVPTTSTTAPTPTTTTTTVSARTTSTTSNSGSLTRRAPSRTYNVTTGPGTLTATASFTKASSLTVTFLRADGSEIARNSGLSPVSLTATVPTGTYGIRVSTHGGGNASYTLTLTYPRP